jgi:hypothetical protein
MKETISQVLKGNRPSLSASSLKTYTSIISAYMTRNDILDLGALDHHAKDIIKGFEALTPMQRKTKLSAFFILTQNDEYRKQMLDDCKVVNTQYKEQRKTPKEVTGWIGINEIQEIYEKYRAAATLALKKKPPLELGAVVCFLLLGFQGAGVSGLVPRRSLDWTEMKIRNINPKVDNYYKNGVFFFNKYKTAKKYGLQKIDVGAKAPELNGILKKWVKVNKSDFMLFSSNGKPLKPPQVTHMLNNIFGKNVSTDMLRHVFFTHFFKDKAMPSILDMEEVAKQAGTSTAVMLQYIKND